MGEQPAPVVVLLHTSSLNALSAHCDELQARSVRIRAEARVLTAHQRDLNDASAVLRATPMSESRRSVTE
jgi:hypothetical protein